MLITEKRQLVELFESQAKRRWELAATGPAERIAKLNRLRAGLLARCEELYAAVKADYGKRPSRRGSPKFSLRLRK